MKQNPWAFLALMAPMVFSGTEARGNDVAAVASCALPLVCELRREAERQHIEIHFLRGP
jgi:hypothetical protein